MHFTHCTVVRLEFDQHDYRIKEGTNNNQLRATVKTVENQNVELAREIQLKVTPLTFQQQEALGIPLPPDFPPKPVAASGMFHMLVDILLKALLPHTFTFGFLLLFVVVAQAHLQHLNTGLGRVHARPEEMV